mmetsp:Transcript_19610/g.14066  ORF Transcript_19610/g.14066 Transcript_19610/m.14066 type:complete len:164 (+) Transcript_19610:1276-1767(+)
MKYFPGSIFVNSYASTIADVLGYTFGGMLFYKLLGLKLALFSCFCISTIGSILIVIFANSSIFSLFVLIAKFGIAGGFVIVYVANADLFPTLFSVTAFGSCNTISRFATIFAPNLAEVPGNTPMIICGAICAFSAVAILFVTTGPEARLEDKSEDSNKTKQEK